MANHVPPPSPPRDVHNVCSWDEKAAHKIQKALEEEILSFTKAVQVVG